MLKATRVWHCQCCNEKIKPGDLFYIRGGEILKKDHPTKSKPKLVLTRTPTLSVSTYIRSR